LWIGWISRNFWWETTNAEALGITTASSPLVRRNIFPDIPRGLLEPPTGESVNLHRSIFGHPQVRLRLGADDNAHRPSNLTERSAGLESSNRGIELVTYTIGLGGSTLTSDPFLGRAGGIDLGLSSLDSSTKLKRNFWQPRIIVATADPLPIEEAGEIKTDEAVDLVQLKYSPAKLGPPFESDEQGSASRIGRVGIADDPRHPNLTILRQNSAPTSGRLGPVAGNKDYLAPPSSDAFVFAYDFATNFVVRNLKTNQHGKPPFFQIHKTNGTIPLTSCSRSSTTKIHQAAA
jgi:hypothetical protein